MNTVKRAKLKILHIVQCIGYGGMEGRILRLAKGLDPDRYDISIVSLREPPAGQFELPPNVRHTYVPIPAGLHFGRLLVLARFIRRGGYDIVHTHNWATMFYGVLAARLALRPRVLHGEHGLNIEDLNAPPSFKRLAAQRLLALLVNLIIHVNMVIEENLLETWKVRRDKVTVIINGVDLQRFKPIPALAPEGELVLGAVARMEGVKNVGCLLEAAAVLARRGLPVRVRLVGDGPLRADLTAQAAGLGIAGRVSFEGERKDVCNAYPAFTMLVNTSFYEGMSNTLLEGMACGLPLMASSVPGNRLWLSDENAVFFDPARPDDLADRVEALWRDPQARSAMAARNRARAESEFDNRRFLAAYSAVYERICGNA